MNATNPAADLVAASQLGDERMVSRLLAEGVPPDATVEGGPTALQAAIVGGHVGVVSVLVAAGVDLTDIGSGRSFGPLELASRSGHAGVLGVLLSAGVLDAEQDGAVPVGPRALVAAVLRGSDRHHEVADVLLRWGVAVNAVVRALTPLEWAARSGQVDMAILLLDRGASPTARAVGYARHGASKWPRIRDQFEQVVAVLLAAGAPEPTGDWEPSDRPGPMGAVRVNSGFTSLGGGGRRANSGFVSLAGGEGRLIGFSATGLRRSVGRGEGGAAANESSPRRERRQGVQRQTTAPTPVINVRRHGQILAPQGGDLRVSVSVGPSGEAIALWSAAEDLSALRPAFPSARATRPAGATVTVHAPDMAIATRIGSLPIAHPTVQPLPDGQILVVGSRCRWYPEGPDRNAIVYDSAGALVAERTLGDGIGHAFATRQGEVWVGYFDEGIFGSGGWGQVDSDRQLGISGLVRFSTGLTEVWEYSPQVRNGWDAIHDCYALNVAEDEVWTCYYSGFPIVRIQGGTVTGWHNEAGAVKALAVEGNLVAMYGGYARHQGRLIMGVLGADRLQVISEYRVVLPDGQPMPLDAKVVGRGPGFHFFVDDTWMRLDIDDIPVNA